MCEATQLKCGPCCVWAARIVSGVILLGVVGFVLTHESMPALPPNIPSDVQITAHTKMEAKAATAEAVKDLVSLMITLSFGLTAIVGFALKDGLGKKPWLKAMNPIAISIFVYFLARALVYAYDTYAVLIIQLDSGYLFVVRLNELLVLQGHALIIAAGLALGTLYLNLMSADT